MALKHRRVWAALCKEHQPSVRHSPYPIRCATDVRPLSLLYEQHQVNQLPCLVKFGYMKAQSSPFQPKYRASQELFGVGSCIFQDHRQIQS